MKHRVSLKKLNRPSQHRKMMVANLTSSLIIYEKIKTTSARAKVVASNFDKVMTEAKKGTMASKRNVNKMLFQNDLAVAKVNEVYTQLLNDRKSGYTRKYNIGNRKGDNSVMVLLEIIKPEKEKKTKENKARKEDKKEDKKETKEVKTKSKTEKEAKWKRQQH